MSIVDSGGRGSCAAERRQREGSEETGMAMFDLPTQRLNNARVLMRQFMQRTTLTLVALLMTVSVQLAAQPAATQRTPLPPDVRLVVDVSGSMKQTDPENLRRPALELLTRLLPDNARAGVWTFGHQVNMLVPHQDVDADWKARALAAAQKINSVALYTNIGQALEWASYDLEQGNPGYERHLILLTDGKVDVSPIAEINQNEQQRLLQQLIPSLSEAGFRIHTIALSEQADSALLQELAQRSDGIFSRAENADQLLGSLVQILQQSVPADSLPLEDNRFLVDERVREFTALVMRTSGSTATALVSPSDETYRQGDRPANINWHSTDAYDLITVQEPQAGRWRIDAELGPNSRVTVVSDLQLLVQPLPNNLPVNHPQTLEFSLTEEQQTITDVEFLDLLSVQVEIIGPKGSPRRKLSWDKAPPVNGVYQLGVLPLPAPGTYQLKLSVDGKTFQRGFSHQLSVSSLFSVELEKTIAEDQVHYRIEVSADPEAVDPANTSVVAHVKNSTGYTAVRNLEQDEAGWTLQITPEEPAHYSVDLEVSGQRYDGASLRETLTTQYFRFPEPGDPYIAPEDQALAELEAELAKPKPSKPDSTHEASEEDAPESAETTFEPVEASEPKPAPEAADEEESTFWLYTSLVLANLLAVALIFFGYRMIAGSRAEARDGAETEPEAQNQNQEDIQVGAPPPMQDIDAGLDDSTDNLEPKTDSAKEVDPASRRKPEEEFEDSVQIEDDEIPTLEADENDQDDRNEGDIDLETLDAWNEAEFDEGQDDKTGEDELQDQESKEDQDDPDKTPPEAGRKKD